MKALYWKLKSQAGQGTVEYALITLAVVGIIVVVLANNGPFVQAINAAFAAATNAITGATPVPPAA